MVHDAREKGVVRPNATTGEGSSARTPEIGPHRSLSTGHIAMLAVAMVVGAGVFRSPAAVAAAAGTAQWTYFAWVIGGVISLIGAMCYAELASAFPDAGGDYHFLKTAYGRRIAFLFAWARLGVINTGQIALLGFVLGGYLNNLVWIGPAGDAIYAAGTILSLTLYNLRPRKIARASDFLLTGLEVAGVAAVIVAGAWLVVSGQAHPPAGGAPDGSPVSPVKPDIGGALVFAMLAYGGWSEISTLSAEARDGRKGMVRALIASVLLISGLYIAVNWALLSGLGFAGLSASEAPAAELMSRAFGPWAGPLIATAIVIAVATSINATILTGGRTLYACARDWPDLAGLSAWTGDRGGPRAAIWLQSLTALILVGVGAWLGEGFEAMVDFTSPVFWIFMTLSGLAVIVLRVRQPDLPRPFRVPLYPLPPIVFTFSSALMGLSASVYAAGLVSVDAGETSPFGVGVRPAAVIGGVTLLAGVLVLCVLQRRAARPSRDSPE